LQALSLRQGVLDCDQQNQALMLLNCVDAMGRLPYRSASDWSCGAVELWRFPRKQLQQLEELDCFIPSRMK